MFETFLVSVVSLNVIEELFKENWKIIHWEMKMFHNIILIITSWVKI